MPIRVLDSDAAPPDIGLTFRNKRPGPERELIDWFLAELPLTIPRGCRATVFCEPRLESGFPDIVAVIWNVRTTKDWAEDRANLSQADLRLNHYLHHIGQCDDAHLATVFGRGTAERMERLTAAGMTRRIRNSWVTRALSGVFAVRQIIAVEAKVNEWASALEQAFLNTWFASESYILVPRLPRGDRLIQEARSLGIGVWSMEDSTTSPQAPTCREDLPRSYASWLFNEWSWRAARLDEEYAS